MFATILIVLVALIHAYFLVLEMFLWEGPRARRVFGLTPEFAAETRVLAANQGLYNGFLSAGLVFGLIWGSAGGPMVSFLLLCVVVAGIYDAMTATKAALFAQTIPASLALIALFLNI
jgi:putative membrane protein